MVNEQTPLLASHANHESEAPRPSLRRFLTKSRLGESVDPDSCGAALTWQCAIAGAADAAAFGQTGTWVGFMTGNLTQLAISAVNATLTRPVPSESLKRIVLSSSALVGFVVGSLLAAWIDAHYHGKHRGKLVLSALARAAVFALMTPWLVWHGWEGFNGLAVLFIMAINMGSMAVSATKLGSTPYNTTVVITSSLASLFSDPRLPYGLSNAAQTRAVSIIALVLGGAASQTVIVLSSRWLESTTTLLAKGQPNPVGSALAVGIVAVLEVLCAAAWLLAKPTTS